MRILSPANEYTIVARLRDGRRFFALDREGRSCVIAVEKKPHEAKRLVPVLTRWKQISEFSDFYEFFPYKGGVAAVFARYEGGRALDAALEDMPYPQRAEALRAVFALILRQSLPEEILRGVMYPENLRIYPSGKAELMYDLPGSGDYALRYTVRSICKSSCTAPEIERLYAKSENVTAADYAKLYGEAGYAADRLSDYIPPVGREKLTLGKIKERAETIKAAATGRIAPLLAVTAIVAGYIAVGLFFYRAVIAPPGVDNGIASIGTVVICDDG